MLNITSGWDMAYLLMHAAFEELGYAHRLIQALVVNPDELSLQECSSASIKIEMGRVAVHRRLIASVILFQAGMEGIYQWMYSKDPTLPKPNSFVKTWENALKIKGLTTDFSVYKNFYENIRIAIAHPDNPQRFANINNLEFVDVYIGIQSGWFAFEALSSAIGCPHDKDSWAIMCNAREVPPTVDISTYPKLKELLALLDKKRFDR